jgi:hypothetical protein
VLSLASRNVCFSCNFIARRGPRIDLRALAHGSILAARYEEPRRTFGRSPLAYRPSSSTRRWIEHLENRTAYEKAMLGEAGGIATAQFAIEVGGRVSVGDEWVVVLKLNRVGGMLNSVNRTRFGTSTVAA